MESASVHVALSETSDYLAAATDAEGSVTTSSLEDLYENTPEGGTLVLDADYNEGLVIDKAVTINGGGHSIGNLKVENEGDLTLSSSRIYPNPTTGNVTIEANNMKHITVISTLGQVLYDANISGDTYTMNLGQYQAGLYMVRIFTENGVSVKRVTVVK